MPNKTRKQRKQQGGAKPHLPRSIAPVPEGKFKRDHPQIKKIVADFFENNFYYINAHGLLFSTQKYTVPPNTYILHIAESGKVCGQDKRIVDIITGEDFDNTYDKQFQFWKFLTGQIKGDIYNNIFYSKERFEVDKYNVAIYEPGDKVNDMLFDFKNPSLETGYVVQGVYKFPVSNKLFEDTHKVAIERVKESEKKIKEWKNAGKKEEEITDLKKEFGIEFGKKHDTYFYELEDNLIVPYLTRKLSDNEEESRYFIKESNLINLDNFKPKENKFNVFIVFSCRQVGDINVKSLSNANKETLRQRVRRESINLREYAEGVKPAAKKENKPAEQTKNKPANKAANKAANNSANMNVSVKLVKLNAFLKSLGKGELNEELLEEIIPYLSQDDQKLLKKNKDRFAKELKPLLEAKEQLDELMKEIMQYYTDVFKIIKEDLERENK